MHRNNQIINYNAISVDPLELPEFKKNGIQADALRLDKIHPVISGNKWFKLRNYLAEAIEKKSDRLITFGGAYSNHIVATACAANEAGFRSLGFIRGEEIINLSHTLQISRQFGMELEFISREKYKRKNEQEFKIALLKKYPGSLIIPEGGSGISGIEGCREIVSLVEKNRYTHIFCAIGTGTMYIGLANASEPQQYIIGIPVLRGIKNLKDIRGDQLIDEQKTKFCQIHDGYDFGGYAKKKPELLDFMNRLYGQSGIPTDFVYTGKLFYAAVDLAKKKYFPPGTRLLIIHSGGLQGNLSLPEGSLAFEYK